MSLKQWKIKFKLRIGSREQVSHAGLPPMWSGFNSWTWHQMWVEFVVGSHPCSKKFFFSGYSGFPLSSKTNISKFQLTLKSLRGTSQLNTYLFIYLFIYKIGPQHTYMNCFRANMKSVPSEQISLCNILYIVK